MASKRQAMTPGRPVRHQYNSDDDSDDGDDLEDGNTTSRGRRRRNLFTRKIRLFIQTKLESFRVRAEVTASHQSSAGRRELIALFSFLSMSILVVFALMIWYSLGGGSFGSSSSSSSFSVETKRHMTSALPKEIEVKI